MGFGVSTQFMPKPLFFWTPQPTKYTNYSILSTTPFPNLTDKIPHLENIVYHLVGNWMAVFRGKPSWWKLASQLVVQTKHQVTKKASATIVKIRRPATRLHAISRPGRFVPQKPPQLQLRRWICPGFVSRNSTTWKKCCCFSMETRQSQENNQFNLDPQRRGKTAK